MICEENHDKDSVDCGYFCVWTTTQSATPAISRIVESSMIFEPPQSQVKSSVNVEHPMLSFGEKFLVSNSSSNPSSSGIPWTMHLLSKSKLGGICHMRVWLEHGLHCLTHLQIQSIPPSTVITCSALSNLVLVSISAVAKWIGRDPLRSFYVQQTDICPLLSQVSISSMDVLQE